LPHHDVEVSMKRLLVLVALGAAVLVPTATAGGWATVQLSAVPTDGTKAGTTLPIDITVLQHGVTPVEGVTPVFRIRDGQANILAEYRGAPTGKPGVYHVDVTFPESGLFNYEVYDGFDTYGGAQVHAYPVVQIGPDGGGSAVPWLPLAIGIGLAAALAAALVLLVRRARHAPAAAPQA
jgi:hypothetical protein